MSDQDINQILQRMEMLERPLKWIWVLVCAGFAFGAWSAALTWRLGDHDTRIQRAESKLDPLSERLGRIEENVLGLRADIRDLKETVKR